jgi:hypothetical protein
MAETLQQTQAVWLRMSEALRKRLEDIRKLTAVKRGESVSTLVRASDLSRRIQETAYVMELFPRTQGQVGPPFPSEATAPFAAKWLASYDPKDHPNALFFFAADSYAGRCRRRRWTSRWDRT